jgi:hypothetical protein
MALLVSRGLVTSRPEHSGRLRAAKLVVPCQQGEFDGFCGLYSVINALQLVLATTRPLSPRQCETLFKHGIAYLHEQQKLSAAARFGLRPRLWGWLADDVTAKAARLSRRLITVQRPLAAVETVTFSTLLDAIEAAVDCQKPALLLLRGHLKHFTVVIGYSRSRLMLFDSYALRWIAIASSDVSHGGCLARHQIHPRSLMVLSS